MLSLILLVLVLVVMVVGGLWLVYRAIGYEPQHAGGDPDTAELRLDLAARPWFERGPDKLDRLIADYALPVQALADLLATDRLIKHADAVLGAR